MILERDLEIKIRDIVEAIDVQKDKKFRPELKNEERKEVIRKLKLDQFKNDMHFDVPGIGYLGSPFVALENKERHE